MPRSGRPRWRPTPALCSASSRCTPSISGWCSRRWSLSGPRSLRRRPRSRAHRARARLGCGQGPSGAHAGDPTRARCRDGPSRARLTGAMRTHLITSSQMASSGAGPMMRSALPVLRSDPGSIGQSDPCYGRPQFIGPPSRPRAGCSSSGTRGGPAGGGRNVVVTKGGHL
jgi:hypothetical protein